MGFVVSTDGLTFHDHSDYSNIDFSTHALSLRSNSILVHECAVSAYDMKVISGTSDVHLLAHLTCAVKAKWSKVFRNHNDRALYVPLKDSVGANRSFKADLRTVDVNSVAEFGVASRIINSSSGTISDRTLKSMHINANVKWWGHVKSLTAYPEPVPNPYKAR